MSSSEKRPQEKSRVAKDPLYYDFTLCGAVTLLSPHREGLKIPKRFESFRSVQPQRSAKDGAMSWKPRQGERDAETCRDTPRHEDVPCHQVHPPKDSRFLDSNRNSTLVVSLHFLVRRWLLAFAELT